MYASSISSASIYNGCRDISKDNLSLDAMAMQDRQLRKGDSNREHHMLEEDDDNNSTGSGCGINLFSNHSRTDQKELCPSLSQSFSSFDDWDAASKNKKIVSNLKASAIERCVSNNDMTP
jgi:hypothetical protein